MNSESLSQAPSRPPAHAPQAQTRSLRLGPIQLDFPVVQAALSGYSDWAMRVIARRLGAPYTLCEVLLDKFVVQVSRGKKADRYLRVTDEEHPVGAQLMGAIPEDFAPAAQRLVASTPNSTLAVLDCPYARHGSYSRSRK